MSWHQKTLAQLSKSLINKDISSLELSNYYLNRMELRKDLNAYLDIQPELTLAQARQADTLRTQGKAGPLTGIPIAHKDVFVSKGWATTAASKILRGYISPFDAAIVEALGMPCERRPQAAGMVCLGKTNMDEFAMGSSNENSAYGPALNPWNSKHVSGGSSGGSAVAVAAGLAPIATGTDTGGSIRQPAAFCGLTGIKPTYGRVSRYGMIAYASSLDQAGPIGKTAEDCALLLSAMSFHDSRDSTSLSDSGEDYSRCLNATWSDKDQSKPLAGLRVGLPKEFYADGLSPEVAKALLLAKEALHTLGASVCEVSLPKQNYPFRFITCLHPPRRRVI